MAKKQYSCKQQGEDKKTAAAAATATAKEEEAPQYPAGRKAHPLDAASAISKLLFGWVFPFIWRGWRVGLRETDMPKVSTKFDSCQRVGKKLLVNWEKELTKHPATGKVNGDQQVQGRLFRALLKTHASWILFSSALVFLAEVVCKSLCAYSVGQILRYISERTLNKEFTGSIWSFEDPLVCWSSVLILASVVWVLTIHFYGFQMMRIGLHARVGCSYLIYRKSLLLDQQESNRETIGKVINLLSSDLEKFNYSFILVPFIWVGPLQTLVSIYLLWPVLGFACLSSLIVLAFLVPVQYYLSNLNTKYRTRISNLTDERVNILNETITALRLIKLYAWESFFRAALQDARKRETDQINRYVPPAAHAQPPAVLNQLINSPPVCLEAAAPASVLATSTILNLLTLLTPLYWPLFLTSTLTLAALLHSSPSHLVCLTNLTRMGIIKGISNAFMHVSSRLVLFVTIIFHCLLSDGTLDAKTLFMSMALLNNVQFPITQLVPRAVVLGSDSIVSMRRVEAFLLSKEFETSKKLKLQSVKPSAHKPSTTPNQVTSNNNGEKLPAWHNIQTLLSLSDKQIPLQVNNNNIDKYKSNPFIEFNKVSACWPGSGSKTIEGISFRCESPGLIMICGQVASGKSSLFMSMLNELPISEGEAVIKGTLGYASQMASIFNGTVRDNIVFGREFEEERYQRVVEVCALKRDLQLLGRSGDLTYIQENSLSGGQKARVNLARCLYWDADIYLLDDPFSAIDAEVANHIFAKAITEFLKDKLVLLVTHKVSLLNKSDKILLLDEGKQLAYCTYQELTDKVKSRNDNQDDLNDQQTKWLVDLTKDEDNKDEKKIVPEIKHSGFTEIGQVKDASKNIDKDNTAVIEDESELLSKDKDSVQAVENIVKATNSSVENGLPDHVLPNSFEQKQTDNHERTLIQKEQPDPFIVNRDNTDGILVHAPYGSEGTGNNQDLIIVPEGDRQLSVVNNLSRTDSTNICARGVTEKEGQFVNKVNSALKLENVQNNHSEKKAHYRSELDEVNTFSKITEKVPEKAGALVNDENTLDKQGPDDEDSTWVKNAGWKIWFKYYTETSVIRFVLLLLTLLMTQASFSTIDIYLTVWTLVDQNKALISDIRHNNHLEFNKLRNDTYMSQYYSERNNSNIAIGSIIPYDNMKSSLSLADSFQRLNFENYKGYVSSKASANEINQKIGKGSVISPLPPWSLSLTQSAQQTVEAQSATLFTNAYKGHESKGNYHDHQMKLEHYIAQQAKNNQRNADIASLIITDTSTSNDSAHSVLVDGNIFEESEEALNVKSIYRPLYLLVNNFTFREHTITYFVLLVVLFSFSTLANVIYYSTSNKSAISLYRKLTDSALYAKVTFFDQNPIGRFLNRATRDTSVIDDHIPENAIQAYDLLLQTLGAFVLITAVNFNLVLPSFVVLVIIVIFQSIHIESTRDIQRFEGVARSPILTNVTTSLSGIHTIRATKSESRFEQLFTESLDEHTSVFVLHLGCTRTMSIVLDALSVAYTSIVAILIVVLGLNGPTAGLILTSAMSLCGLTRHGFTKLSDLQSSMTSVERVIEYSKLPQEENYDRNSKVKAASNNTSSTRKLPPTSGCFIRERKWPTKGCVEYSHVDLYYDKLKKPVLKNLSFKLNAGEKVAIVGRTGAGKSSIITTLFRLYDFEGTIMIDGVDIKTVVLSELRMSIGIIPQNPVLFSTSIRKNLDPTNSYDDFSLWSALDKAHLRTTVCGLPGKLDYTIKNGGDNFSSGQRQLMCLARVMLRQCSLIVMDEATASVDSTTDAIIQSTIRREFKNCTVITIAHRLETILDYDRIMVLDAGRIVEFDTPEQLAAKNVGYIANQLRKSKRS